MPRAPRIEFAGAIYHVMNRGDHLEPIFSDDQDRKTFLKTLGEACQSSGWAIHSFVFMRNHYHLLLETLRPTLVKGMQYLNATYTQRYNSRHKLRGHLFQGRYKALLVDGESENYFLTVSDYIHLNPLRIGKAKTLKDLLKDPWNSAGWLAEVRKGRPDWLRPERIYEEFGFSRINRKARKHYQQHLQKQIQTISQDKGWDKIRRGWVFGAEAFVGQMKERIADLLDVHKNVERWRGEPVEEAEEVRAERLLALGLKKLGYQGVEKLPAQDRNLLGYWLRSQTAIKHQWLAQRLGLKSAGGMRLAVCLAKQALDEQKDARRKWLRLNGK